ncbi:putative DNA-binding protein (UPF0251 family) [Clostridium tetanomorphum]|uniref:UPF0251 protein HGG79_12870 n=1 Tax=Clostridium tetanomorphum TaxID=1553 RepID=A0A923EDK6_CLOTT|nr:DUF134 domain-containing protein [Clostridium tetanomorphum]KAJ51649.1 hypothetical protein CTM_11630 [Clostridium tetanomorphum DSM 665]KAJ51929.1 hypothetical protein CTM_10601 [Clostridium tetanomorphum DSM 665]MBC2398658.1 DUF134 domain-containing protein [Clostridium tetanomorphum]MBP1864062.1 putative DNA-binding protein (UPF0251 family) [Clostridium tetanomorphum]NRS84475.1 putative DNA-binding protein (UPF0251 family) [Clostridium tetanomorphum]
MGRPRKWRRVCTLPQVDKFGPVDILNGISESIIMTVEEYETIRLMDLEGLTQEQCADTMGVARSTIQRIYDDARKKMADSLVNGKILKIEGGDYKLCSDFEDKVNCDECIRGRHRYGRNRKVED